MQAGNPKDLGRDEDSPEAPAPTDASNTLPKDDPSDYEKKVWVEAKRLDATAAITVSRGEFRSSGAPYDLFLEFGRKTLETFKAFGGGLAPTIVAAIPLSSMSLFLRDPHEGLLQQSLPVETTKMTAEKMASLLALNGDELFDRAIAIGVPSLSYRNLVEFVVENELNISIAIMGKTVTLDHGGATEQLAILDREPELVSETHSVRGLLYRVIEKGPAHGTIGIRLKAPMLHDERTGGIRLFEYKGDDIRETIKNGLIGEMVELKVDQQRPKYGTSISNAPVRESIVAISKIELPRGLWT